MDKFTKKYKDFMFESLQDQLKSKINEPFNSLKRGILDLLDNSVKNNIELVEVQNLIHSYIEDSEKTILNGLVDDNDVFDFYLKYQANIDEICNDNDYFDKAPKENNVFSLYKYIIDGTKFGVLECIKLMEIELF